MRRVLLRRVLYRKVTVALRPIAGTRSRRPRGLLTRARLRETNTVGDPGFWSTKNDDGDPGGDGDVLAFADLILHDVAADWPAGVEAIQLLTRRCVEHEKIAGQLSGHHDATC